MQITRDSRILITGGSGLLGSALVRELKLQDFLKVLAPGHEELDLLGDPIRVAQHLTGYAPDAIIHCAGRVGGIVANRNNGFRWGFENAQMALSVIGGAVNAEIPRLFFIGSACMYPKDYGRISPLQEGLLWHGKPEGTNLPYAAAKLLGSELCFSAGVDFGLDYRTIVPCNLFGLGDNYHPVNSHVIPGMFRRIAEACMRGDWHATLWGTGRVSRDFLFADDAARMIVHLLKQPELWRPVYNIGPGRAYQLREVAKLVLLAMGLDPDKDFRIDWDITKPDGPKCRQLDIGRLLETGWRPGCEAGLLQGLSDVWQRELSHKKPEDWNVR